MIRRVVGWLLRRVDAGDGGRWEPAGQADGEPSRTVRDGMNDHCD